MGRRTRRKTKRQSQRVNIYNSKPIRLLRLHTEIRSSDPIADTRRWNPPLDDLPRKINGQRVNFTITNSNNKKKHQPSLTQKVTFKDAKKVMVCVRRKARRVSLFASKKIGSGKRVTSKRRYNENSKIKC